MCMYVCMYVYIYIYTYMYILETASLVPAASHAALLPALINQYLPICIVSVIMVMLPYTTNQIICYVSYFMFIV